MISIIDDDELVRELTKAGLVTQPARFLRSRNFSIQIWMIPVVLFSIFK